MLHVGAVSLLMASFLQPRLTERKLETVAAVLVGRMEAHASDTELLNSLQWFVRTVPDVQRRWRAGTLVGPGKPETL